MKPRARRAVGSALTLVYLVAYIVVAGSIGTFFALAPEWAMIAYFVVAGLAWPFPLFPLFKWMLAKRAND